MYEDRNLHKKKKKTTAREHNHQLAKDLTSEKQGRSKTIQDNSGKCHREEEKSLSRWTEYCSELYNHGSYDENTVLGCIQPSEEHLKNS